jgi:sulfate adenylyltransferase
MDAYPKNITNFLLIYKYLNYLYIIMHLNKSITLSTRLQNDLELILNGALSPLQGFMSRDEYLSVLDNMKLLDGSVFSLPINLYINVDEYELIKNEEEITLKDEQGFSLAIMYIDDIYKPDLENECIKAYGTSDDNHPFVKLVYERRSMYYVGGRVQKLELPRHYDFKDIRLTPTQTRQYFKDNNWDIIIGFQTRNPMHRSHYELTKYALKQVGNNAHLLLHPVVGMTQECDVEYHTRVRCYKEMMKYYDDNQVLLSLLPLSMRMAGPREAVMHAIIRKNYGCTHFIVGRDHAGPSYKTKEGKDFYGPFDAQDLLNSVKKEIGIEVITSKMIVYVKELENYLPMNEVDKDHTVMNISGTQQRELLRAGKIIPEWFTFKEVSEILRKEIVNKKLGRCYYFIGLSGAGKSATANALKEKIHECEPDRTVTILDADIIRQNLSKGLGFSKEDRSINVKRIGYVASEIVKHGGICIVANIAPYEEERTCNRKLISQYGEYNEIYVKTNINICEERDCKGLYKLARLGKIKQFTGIDDPFEEPKTCEYILDGTLSIDDNIKLIYKY